MDSPDSNLLRGMILPRAIPAMSGMIASISVMRCCFRNSSMSCMIVLSVFARTGLGVRGGGGYRAVAGPGAHSIAACIAERPEDRGGQRVARVLPLGVPLHTQSEGARILDAHRFDQSVRRSGFGHEAVAQPLDALSMQGIHPRLVRPRCEALQQAV